MTQVPAVLTLAACDAVLFDLDGVLTATAATHATCWQRMFDAFLRAYAERTQRRQEPFDPNDDYLRYVDGRSRYDGVRAFLASRGITLPEGRPDDPPSAETIFGLGNRKDALFQEVVRDRPPEVYPGSLALLRVLRDRGTPMAVVSGSRNAAVVLEAAGIASFFAVRVDGRTAADLGLAGKPAPDTFLEAARHLGVAPDRAAVVEDAESGVAAARAGGFGLIIGVARLGNAAALGSAGAHHVVADLVELTVGPSSEAFEP